MGLDETSQLTFFYAYMPAHGLVVWNLFWSTHPEFQINTFSVHPLRHFTKWEIWTEHDKNKGYLKQISIKSDKSYFDTNVSEHHHFFDEDMNKLIDLENKHLDKIKIKKKIPGKKIKSVEVLVKVVSNK